MKFLLYFFMLFIIFFRSLTSNVIDYDYWARLLQGNAFLETGSIMKIDPYSYTQTHIWLDHEWGSSVVFSFIQSHFGYTGIFILKVILLFLIFYIMYKVIRLRTEKNNDLFNILLFGFAIFTLPNVTNTGIRCQIFTFVFFALYIYILEYVRKNNKPQYLILLPLIMLIWCNMHGGCVAGLGILFLYVIGESINRKPFKNYLFALIASFIVMFINPYNGYDYVEYIFKAATMSRPLIQEWNSPFFFDSWHFWMMFKVFVIFYAFIIIKNFKELKKDCTKLLVLLACLFVSCQSIKSSPFFIMVSVMFLYENILELMPKKLLNKTLIFISAIIFMWAAASYYKPSNPFILLGQQPFRVVEFLRINELKGTIVAPMELGSYIAYKLYPDILIFMDGRYEEVYYDETKTMSDNFYDAAKGWDEILKDNPTYLIVPDKTLINKFLQEQGLYEVIFYAENNLLYCLKDKVKPVYLNPSLDYNYYVNTLFDRPLIKKEN